MRKRFVHKNVLLRIDEKQKPTDKILTKAWNWELCFDRVICTHRTNIHKSFSLGNYNERLISFCVALLLPFNSFSSWLNSRI